MSRQNAMLIIALVSLICLLSQPCSAATTEIHIVKYANDGTTILNETTKTYQWMQANMPVLGDGTTHYYHQGPVFVDDITNETHEQELRWNPDEDTNVQEKDMGAVKGTNLKDLCNLVGGMSAGERVKILSSDGWNRWFAYKNVYDYSSQEGPIGICWYKNSTYPDSGYSDGMRMVWFADTSTNPWGIHAFGNFDWHEAAAPEYWYYYQSGAENYPTTTGISGQSVNRIFIYSNQAPPIATSKYNIGVTNGQQWYLDWNGNGEWDTGTDKEYAFGATGWTPVVGDWNATGKTLIGITNGQQWYLDSNGDGIYDTGDGFYMFGLPGWTPVVGDWNQDGKTEIGVYKDGAWYLDTNGDEVFDAGDSMNLFGLAGWSPVVGDWNGDNTTDIGVTNGKLWYLDMNDNRRWDSGDRVNNFGSPGWTPIVGDWNGDGKGTKLGVYKDGAWYLDTSGDGAFGSGDSIYSFGLPGWTSVAGKWS